MPIANVNLRLLILKQDAHKPVPGKSGMCRAHVKLIYPDSIHDTPEELFEFFKCSADPSVFAECEIPQGEIISYRTHHKALEAFCEWLLARGFQWYYVFEDALPVLEIPPQVTLIRTRRYRP